MDKVEAKELTKAIGTLAKNVQDYNKNVERLVKALTDANVINSEIRTRLLTLSTSIDKLTEKQTII